MAKITAINPIKRDPQQASIRVGSKVAATLSIKSIAELGLKPGRQWNELLAAQVAEAALYDKALRAAMARLNRRAMTRQQLDDKLNRLDFAPAVRQRVLDRLTELDLINDEAIGRELIREIQLRNAAGSRLLQSKLIRQGLDRELVDRLVDEAISKRNPIDDAMQLALGRMQSMRNLDWVGQKRRLWGLLARRGYDPDTIEAAIQRLPASTQNDDDSQSFSL